VKEVTARIRRGLSENLAYKVITLGFAVVLWAWVQSQHRVEGRVQVPIEWTAPEGMAFVEPPLETATVRVEGIQAFVRALPQTPMSIAVDLTKASAGDVAVDLGQRRVVGLPNQVLVKEITPGQLRLTLDRILKRRLPVTPATVGRVADGFRLVAVTVEPDRAEVEGAASVLRAMDGVSTAEVDLGGLRDDQSVEVALSLRKGLRPSQVTRYTVTVDVEPIISERSFSGVPVLVRDAGWVSVTPTVDLRLAGPVEELASFDPGQISVVAIVPPGRVSTSVDARRGRNEGPRYEVVHGGSSRVEVVGVEPAVLKLVRSEVP